MNDNGLPKECWVAGHDFASDHLEVKYNENNIFICYIKARFNMLFSRGLLVLISMYIERLHKRAMQMFENNGSKL